MSNENDALLPEEDETETQTLNKMVAKIKSMDNRLETVETKVDAQSKRTNANLLNAFAEILRDALAQQKAEFEQTLKDALAQQEIKFEQALAQQEVKFTEMIKTEVNHLRVEMLGEFKKIKLEIRNIDRHFHFLQRDVAQLQVRTDDLEDKVEQIETKLKAS
ncbi:MAG: hypothetical protein J0M03_14970 [Acidobacteria bacterium]|nr:hypothetical protein [Acidobacteriota bacterium]